VGEMGGPLVCDECGDRFDSLNDVLHQLKIEGQGELI